MNKIIDPELKEIIERSGNSFHSKVVQYLEKNKWVTLISPYYIDVFSNKSREIDIYAQKSITNFKQKNIGDIVNLKIFIECKYISQKTIFWFHDRDNGKSESLLKNLDSNLLGLYQTRPDCIHHYLKENNVGKLFADSNKKDVENNAFFKAINQVLNGFVYYRNKKSIHRLSNFLNPIAEISYPVIICNNFDNFYRINMGTDDQPSKIHDNFLMEVNYAYRSSNGKEEEEYFLIDIVDFHKIDQFIELINTEAVIIGNFFSSGLRRKG